MTETSPGRGEVEGRPDDRGRRGPMSDKPKRRTSVKGRCAVDTPVFVPGRGMVVRRDLTPADIEKILDSRSRLEGELVEIVEQHGGILIDETDERGQAS